MALPSFLRFRRKGELEKKGPASRRQQKKKAGDTANLHRRMPGGLGLVTFIALMTIWASCCFNVIYRIYQPPDLIVGQKAPNNLYAKTDFEVIDDVQTEVLQDSAADRVPNHYKLNPKTKAFPDKRKRLRDFFIRLRSVRNGVPKQVSDPAGDATSQKYCKLLNEEVTGAQQAVAILAYVGKEELAVKTLAKLCNEHSASWLPILSPTDYERQKERKKKGDYRLKFHGKPLGFDDVASPDIFARVYLKQLTKRALVPKHDDQALVHQIFTQIAVPDLVFDKEATQSKRKRARAMVRPIMIAYRVDKQLLEKGKKVTQEDLVIVNAHSDTLEINKKEFKNLSEIAEDTGVCFWILLAFFFYIFTALPKFVKGRKNVVCASLIVTVNVLMLWGSNYLITEVFQQPPRYVMAAYPLALTSILLTILYSPKVGISFGFLLALLQGALAGESAAFLITLGMVQSVTGALAVRSVRTRLQISRVMLYLPLFSIILMSLFLTVRHQDTQLNSYLQCIWISVVSAGLMVIITNMLLPVLEWVFGLLSDISLLELSDLNHPLLKRLSLEAPGTYTHTMMVATLSEHAAEAIGANTLLTRVMSYFHDIGKLSNPIYFTENSFGDNHHEDLSPKMSERIINKNVKEGLIMAQKYKLKEQLREAIATHHGTGLVYFFYHLAKTENSLDGSGGEAEYRYPGPNPKSPEATIISLADSCEAASRSLQKPSPQKIDALVDDIFKGKLLDGLMVDSSLSMGELQTVVTSIKKTIRVMLHGRIAYPKNEDLEKVKTAGFGEKKREMENTRLANIRKEKEKTAEMKIPADLAKASEKMDASSSTNSKPEDTKIAIPVATTKEDNGRDSQPERQSDHDPSSETTGTGDNAEDDARTDS